MAGTFIKALCFLLFIITVSSETFSQQGMIRTVYFKTNSAVIENKYKTVLNEIAAKANSDSVAFLKIFAYADPPGSKKHNDWLSKQRAMAIETYLRKQTKIGASKIYVTWIGESAEAYDFHLPDPHVQKRCVDIWLSVVDN